MGYLMLIPSLKKDSSGILSSIAGVGEVPNLSNAISSKVKVIARIGFELVYCNVTVQHVSLNTMWTLQCYKRSNGNWTCEAAFSLLVR